MSPLMLAMICSTGQDNQSFTRCWLGTGFGLILTDDINSVVSAHTACAYWWKKLKQHTLLSQAKIPFLCMLSWCSQHIYRRKEILRNTDGCLLTSCAIWWAPSLRKGMLSLGLSTENTTSSTVKTHSALLWPCDLKSVMSHIVKWMLTLMQIVFSCVSVISQVFKSSFPLCVLLYERNSGH